MPEELQAIFQVIQGGAEVAAENVTEVIADNGAKIADITTHSAFGGNGAATEVAEVVNISEGAAAGTTGGLALLTMEVPTAVAAIAPALGLAGGVALYNIAPDVFDEIARSLEVWGLTVKGKVVSFMDGQGNTSFPEQVIESVKSHLAINGYFSPDDKVFNNQAGIDFDGKISEPLTGYQRYVEFKYFYNEDQTRYTYISADEWYDEFERYTIIAETVPKGAIFHTCNIYASSTAPPFYSRTYTFNDQTVYLRYGEATRLSQYGIVGDIYKLPAGVKISDLSTLDVNNIAWLLIYGNIITPADLFQPGAVLPNFLDPFPETYPDWLPWDLPIEIPNLPDLFPVSLPTPEIVQPGSQSGVNTDPLQIGDLISVIYNPAISDNPVPAPQPDPDVDPVITPESPVIEPIEPSPDPLPPTPTPPIIAPVIPIPSPSTTSANAMFTVYNPTDAQVNALGGFLWTDSIIEQIKKMWEDPMQAIISFHKVYCTPVTSGSSNIVLGYVDSGVSSAVVSDQFVTVNCGNVTIEEWLHNATDYNPFTKAMIYLPFIGIVDVDITDIMNSTVNVTYKIDVYTGTCIAMISCQRSPDMTTPQILYTFSGNASQQLPLTGSSFSGAVGALLGLAGAGIAVASGGAGLAVGAVGAAHSLTQEMVHMQRSGGLSANAGIMAPRYPYIILERQNSSDANAYASYYGFPANKTVNLQNCSGYIRVKSINLKSNATDEEKNMIVQQLKEGVII